MRLVDVKIWSRLAIVVLILGLPAALQLLAVVEPTEPLWPSPATDNQDDDNDNEERWPDRGLIKQADRTASLDAYTNDPTEAVISARSRRRPELLVDHARLQQIGDAAGVARLNAVLSTEAFTRAARVTRRWLDRRDQTTGLFPHTLKPRGRYWSYGDVGSDLLPFLAIGTGHLLPSRYPEILATIAAERGLTTGFPHDVALDTLTPLDQTFEKQMLGNVEYAKDGLLPMLELLGPEPWLPRMRQIVTGILDQARVPTKAGPIPSDAAEVNGSLLQVLARLSWLGDDPRALEMGRRIAAAYLDEAFPRTGYIPPQRWDFVDATAIGEPTLHLGDHGAEIVSGLIEWHRVEIRHGLPEQTAHRAAINRMLDRLLESGRTPAGLWYDGITYPGGNVVDRTLNDNWGYLGQAYLTHTAVLRLSSDPDLARAARYEAAVATMLDAASDLDFFPWEQREMDGYADTVESALYLLRRIDDPKAARWVHEQMPVLYGFQHGDGSVTDENIDGNFVRTAMLYGRWLTQGTRVEPWEPAVSLGAAAEGTCLRIHLHAATPWSGMLRFDPPRHRQHLGLAEDYPRLNEWSEWWSVQPGQRYAVALPDGSFSQVTGDQLADGLPMTLVPGTSSQLRVCGV